MYRLHTFPQLSSICTELELSNKTSVAVWSQQTIGITVVLFISNCPCMHIARGKVCGRSSLVHITLFVGIQSVFFPSGYCLKFASLNNTARHPGNCQFIVGIWPCESRCWRQTCGRRAWVCVEWKVSDFQFGLFLVCLSNLVVCCRRDEMICWHFGEFSPVYLQNYIKYIPERSSWFIFSFRRSIFGSRQLTIFSVMWYR
jgi:hypothetical protein